MTEDGVRSGGRDGSASGLADRVRGLTLGGACRGVATVSFAALCLAVAAVGGVAVVAESVNTWTWYFRMERAVALATPLVVGLLATALSGAIGSVLFTDDY